MMSSQTDTRTPEEIERDIERTRADFSSTVEALQQKLRPSELADQAVEYVMATPSVASTMSVVNSVRENPMPLALIGVGLAWLMASNRQAKHYAHYPRHQRMVRRAVYHPNDDIGYEGAYGHAAQPSGRSEGLLQRATSSVSETGRGLKEKAGAVGERISGTASEMGDRTRQMTQSATARASEVGQRISGTASEIGDRARQMTQSATARASEVGQRISGTASEMGGRARQMTQSATARLQQTAGQAQVRMGQVGQRSQEQFYRAKDQVSHLVDEQPLVIGALGIAMGAALGAALPTTRRENALLGPTRDELMMRARETTREHAETVKQSAQRIADMAKEEIGHVVEVVKEEAAVITDAAKEEARQARDKMTR